MIAPGKPTGEFDEPGGLVVVGSCWGLMFALAIAYVARYGCEIPILDELDYVDVFLGDTPVTANWLWAFHNEHRIVIPKLIQVAVLGLTGANFRATPYLGITLLALCAGALVIAARKLRGGTRYSDAFFPFVLLHWGHFHTFWSGFQVQFISSCCLALVILLIIVRDPGAPGLRATLVAGACLVALPLCGAQGLVLVPPLAVWLGGVSLARLRTGRREGAGQPGCRSRAAIAGLVAATLAGLVVAVCLRGYRTMGHHPAAGGPLAAVRTTAEFVAANLGATVGWLWPLSAVVVIGAVLSALVPLGTAIRRRPTERVRACGLLMFFCACSLLALAVGLGRSGYGPGAGAESRYAIMAVPLLCWAYFAWLLYGRATAAGPAQLGLAATMVAVLLPNATVARERGKGNVAYFAGIERDLRNGMTADEFIDRYTGIYLHRRARERNRQIVSVLSRKSVGPFEWLRVAPRGPSQLPSGVAVAATNAMAWEGDSGHATGDDPYVVLSIGELRPVEAVEVTCIVTAPDPSATLGFYWTNSTQGGFDAERVVFKQVVPGEQCTLRAPVGGAGIDYVRLDLENGATAVRIAALSVLEPPSPATAPP